MMDEQRLLQRRLCARSPVVIALCRG